MPDTKTDPSVSLPDLPPLREVIARHDLRAEKSLGQNFLLDSNITDKIARAAGDLTACTVIEIGPGPGGLTRSLLRAGAKKLVVIEFDPRAVRVQEELSAQIPDGRLEIVHHDALDCDLTALVPEGPRKIVANLPYNIATPLLIGWLKQIRLSPESYAGMTLMFQREVGDRLVAGPGSKSYGRLSVMAQWLCQVTRQFDLPPSVFVPPPKISSSVVNFTPRPLAAEAPSFDAMEGVTAAAFNQRRKMIRSSLKKYRAALADSGLDETLRAENLSVSDYQRLAKALVSGRG